MSSRFYPIAAFPSPSTLFTIRTSSFPSSADLMTLTTLQGALARHTPTLYRLDDDGNAERWLGELSNAYGVQPNRTFEERGSLSEILSTFCTGVKTYLLANESNINVALTYAAASPSPTIVVFPSNEALCTESGLTRMVVGVENAQYGEVMGGDVFGEGQLLSKSVAILQDPAKPGACLADYGVFARALTWFDQSMSSELSTKVLGYIDAPAAVLGWGADEYSTVLGLSGTGKFIHGADWATNLATLTSFQPPEALRQKRAAASTLSEGHHKHTVCFLMTDGDNLQWLLQGFASPKYDWFGSSARGKVAMGWTVSPAMAELAPPVLSYLYREMVPGIDNFVAGPSGVGYAFPDQLQRDSSPKFAEMTAQFMAKADLRLVTVIASANGTMESAASALLIDHETVDGALYFSYEDNYMGGRGKIAWCGVGNSKPIISVREALWEGVNTPASIARKLMELPTDPCKAESYSLVAVHAWSYGVKDVQQTVELLGTGFDVVTPERFVQKVKTFVDR